MSKGKQVSSEPALHKNPEEDELSVFAPSVDYQQKGHHDPTNSHARSPSSPNSVHASVHTAHTFLQAVPEHLHSLARQINNLPQDDLVHIASLTENFATQDVYSLLPYAGSNWFLPRMTEVGENESHWSLRCKEYAGVELTLGGRCMSLPVVNIFLRLIVLILFWFTLWNVLPSWLMLPNGYVWDPLVLVVVSAIVGGFICRLLQIPPLVGVLWIAVVWSNIPHYNYLTEGVATIVREISSKVGLAVIMARAGFSLTIQGIRPHWKHSVLLATLPFLFEGVAHSMIASKVFHYEDDYKWAFLQGMLCSVVSPAVVVPGTLYLQELGYGRGVGPLSLMLSAVGVEVVLGVWTVNFIIELLFGSKNITVLVVLGPVQLIGGAGIGILLGIAFFYFIEVLKREAERLPNGEFEKKHFYSTLDFAFLVFLMLCFSMVFLGYNVKLAGGGSTMCVFFASSLAHFCLKDGKKELEDQKRYFGSWLAYTWDNVTMPCLFALMGSNINLSLVFSKSFFPNAAICLVSSTVVRLVVVFIVQLGNGMQWKHKILVCVGYLGKASAQASLGPIAAALVAAEIAKIPEGEQPSPEQLMRLEFAKNVEQMAALYVMFMAAIASVGLVRGGMAVLVRERPKKRRKRSSTCPVRAAAAAEAANFLNDKRESLSEPRYGTGNDEEDGVPNAERDGESCVDARV